MSFSMIETYQTMLARRIRDPRARTRNPSLTCHINNTPTLLILHEWQHSFHQPDRHCQVDSHNSFPLILGQRIRATPSIAYTRAIDQNIDAAVLLVTSRHGLIDGSRLDQVGLVECECLIGVGKLLWVGADVDAEDETAAFQKEARCCESDPAAAAGNYDDFVLYS